jgi:hypothetical protein
MQPVNKEHCAEPVRAVRPNPPRRAWPTAFENQSLNRCQTGLLILLLSVMACSLGACTSREDACRCTGEASSCDLLASAPEVYQPRFVVIPNPNLAPTLPELTGDAVWLKRSGDTCAPNAICDYVEARWNSYTLYLSKPGAKCGPDIPPSPPDCEKCNFVNPDRKACPALVFANGPDYLTIFSFDGFMAQASPTTTVHLTASNLQIGKASITPTSNATLQLIAPACPQSDILAQTKVFVIQEGMSQPVQFELTELTGQTDMRAAGVTFYSGSIPMNPKLADNFSPNLQIGTVRVLKGKRGTNPVTGEFGLIDATPLHPSRLVFISNYQNGEIYNSDSIRCYADPNKPDGDIDLTRCRARYLDPSGPTLPATPAYLKTDSPLQQLTWVAEFKPAEGGIIPVIDKANGEIVAIEFTIQ